MGNGLYEISVPIRQPVLFAIYEHDLSGFDDLRYDFEIKKMNPFPLVLNCSEVLLNSLFHFYFSA